MPSDLGGGSDEPLSFLPTAVLGGASDESVQYIPSSVLGGGSDEPVTFIPSSSLGSGSDEPAAYIPFSFGAESDEPLSFIPDHSLGGPADERIFYVSGLHFGGTTGDDISLPAPAQSHSGPTGSIAAFPPAFVFSGPTPNTASFGPAFVFGASTGGETAFSSLHAAIDLIAIPVAVGKISLTWTDIAVTPYRIERSPNGQGMWSVIGIVPIFTTLFIDMNATPLVVFDYRVIAFNLVEESSPSNIASAHSPASEPSAPPTPTLPKLRILEFLSPGVYGLERDLDGNIGGSKI